MALFALAAAGLYLIQASAVRNQASQIRHMTVENSATVLGTLIRNSCASASNVQWPALPVSTVSNSLLVWENVFDDNGLAYIDATPGAKATYHYFCLATAENAVYQYDGSVVAPAAIVNPVIANCGDPSPSLKWGPEAKLNVTSLSFSRLDYNRVSIQYDIVSAPGAPGLPNQGPISVSHTTDMTFQMPKDQVN